MRSVVTERSIARKATDPSQEFLQSWVHLRDGLVLPLGEGRFAGTGGTRPRMLWLSPPVLCHGLTLQTFSVRWITLLPGDTVTSHPRRSARLTPSATPRG